MNGLDMAATRSVSVMSLRILGGVRFMKCDVAFRVEEVVLEGDEVFDVVGLERWERRFLLVDFA